MHELSVALGIVRIAEEEAAKVGAEKINGLELEIGTMAGIEFSSLDFVWPLAVKDTRLEKAERTTHIIKARAVCADCGNIFDVQQAYDACPSCRSFVKKIIQGKELKLKALYID